MAALREQRGFTLAELLVVLALLGIVGAVSMGLLLELRLLDAALGRATRAPLLDPALARLQDDVRTAVAAGATPAWSSAPLVLLREDGSRVRYRSVGGMLERHVADAANRPWRRAGGPVAVFDWRFRARGPGVLEVEIEAMPPRWAGERAPAALTIRERLWVALRGGGGRSW